MNSIGGYFGLDATHGIHKFDGVGLNCGRNALRYIVRVYNITEIYVPYYTCPSVWNALRAENVSMHFYRINENMMPILTNVPSNAFILVNNYFGLYTRNIKSLVERYPNVIVDNAQSLYAPYIGLADFNSPRKFFGLPDGAFARVDVPKAIDWPVGTSWDRCAHLLKRIDLGATAGYHDFQINDAALDVMPPAYMSNLTQQLVKNIDYDGARISRLANFKILSEHLDTVNELNIIPTIDDVPLVYPLLMKNSGLRQRLIQNKIFVATYWPGIEQECPQNSFELKLQKSLIPLPIDQRYNLTDMFRILGVVNND